MLPSLKRAVAKLQSMHGRPAPPPTTDPFELAVWENCAYLVDDERRRAVFEELRTRVGLSPRALLSAPEPLLISVLEPGGMKPPHRAEKVRACAQIAQEIGIERLRSAVSSDPTAARKLLKRFPGIGDPGADKILLFARSQASLAPESNALRVLLRLGFGEESKDYGRSYRSVATAVAPELPGDFVWMIKAHHLLRTHGQEVCRRSNPRCELCPLRSECAAYRRWMAKSGAASARLSARASAGASPRADASPAPESRSSPRRLSGARK